MKSTWNKMYSWFSSGDRSVWLHYSVLALVILLPILLPGYVLTLDMVFTPHLPWPVEITNTYPLDISLWLLNQILPGDVVQKIVLLAVLVLSGVGAHLLVKQLSSEQRSFAWQIAAYFAGLLYVINPFIYARLMAGQWLVLLGYALLPFLVRSLYRLLAKSTWRNTVITAAWAFAVTMMSIHMIGMVTVFGVLFVVAAAVKYWSKKEKLVRFIGRLLVAAAMVLLASGYWLVSVFLGSGVVSEIAMRAGEAEFSAFATHGGPLGAVGEVLRLQGFWAEPRQLFALPQDVMPLWGVLTLALWVLVVIGAVRAWKTNRPVAIVMFGSIVVGVVLAASPLMQGLAQTFPLFGGWREPHKFTVLIVVGYVVLGAYGVAWLAEKRRSKLWAISCLALPLLITPTMLWAGAGQLRSVDYPAQWYALNTRLNNEVKQDEKVLFLPWHMYAPYSFSGGRIIANPAEKFFKVPVIISDDPEFADIAPNQADAAKQSIAELLENPHNVQGMLKDQGVRYVILAKEQSWHEYDFLKVLTRVHEDEKIILYEVQQ